MFGIHADLRRTCRPFEEYRGWSSSDSTSLYARLEPPPGSSGFPSHEIALLIPRWDVAELLRSPVPVSISIDPATSRIAAIETGQGLLWVLSGSQASGRAPSIPRPSS